MVKKSFKSRIILPTVFILVALVLSLNLFLMFRFSDLSSSLVDRKMTANINSLNLYLQQSEANAKAAALSLTLHGDLVEAVKAGDRETILQIFQEGEALYQNNFYIISDPSGVVLARTEDPEKYGDSVAELQNVQDALAGKTSIYYESDVLVQVAVFAGAPLYDADGSLLGVISAGVRFDSQEVAQELKTLFQSEVTVFLGDTRVATTIVRDGQSIEGTTLEADIADVVLDHQQEFTGDTDIFGEKYRTYYKPLLNPQGEAFAIFFLGMPEAEITESINVTIRDGILLGFFVLAISIALLYLIISSISKPLTQLSDQMEEMAGGNFKVGSDTARQDEIGRLRKSFHKVADIVHSLIEDINVMIAEHEHGNTDFQYNANDFQGEYKILADNILRLSSSSMRDQLTGLPNRRSFDNRVEWEWIRAVRDKAHMGVLMMDIDHFKNYNDTFGHQQGDAALQIISKAIQDCVQRSVDFACRWGGEEFVVLLPNTELKGAVQVAETIRRAVENTEIPAENPDARRKTISIGVYEFDPEQDNTPAGELVGKADQALYNAKDSGRNRVCTYDPAKEAP